MLELQYIETTEARNGFYPTPEHVAKQMLEGINLNTISSVLEPSAGKGDLAEVVAKAMLRDGHYPYRQDFKDKIGTLDLDCIEIDPTLRAALKDKSYRVVHDDFMTYDTRKQYDLIIMNPPFAQGAEHVLKALSMLCHGGILVALVNAETIRNLSVSYIRQVLAASLSDYGAEITFIEGAFSDAERPTGVEIAMIKATIPAVEKDGSILEGMRKAPTYQKDTVPEAARGLMVTSTIEALIEQYRFEVACGIRLIEEYDTLRPYIINSLEEERARYPILELTVRHESGSRDTANTYIQETRKKYWRYLFGQKAFTEKLTNNLINDLHSMIDSLKDYEFSFYNIMTLAQSLTTRVNGGIEETIINLFDDWTGKYHWSETTSNRRYFDGWKTNDCFAVGKKVIIPFYGAFHSWTGKITENNVMNKFRDIEKVFDFLDSGRADGGYDTIAALQEAEHTGQNRKIQTKHFEATFYKKGTAHLTFRDPILLQRFNLFAARHKKWLPPSYGKKCYKDMDAEEKAVIDSFEGESSYNKVMENPRMYIIEGDAAAILALPAN